jgi:adenylate cyclase
MYRSSSKRFQPVYDNTVAHVDLNNTSIQRLNDIYLDRDHFAQLIRNLSAMGVSAQVFDFIFAAKKDEKGDRALIQATRDAGNVYLGLAFELWQQDQPRRSQPAHKDAIAYVDQTKWRLMVEGSPDSLYEGRNPLITFSDLARASQGLGSLSVKFDRDGVLRRVPLLVRFKDAFYPLLPLRVICAYFKIAPETLILKPGKHIILPAVANTLNKMPHDIVIPIDAGGNMIINFVGAWDRMDHYNFSDILLASEDQDELEIWGEELAGKIIIISDVSTGSTDVGPVPTDANFPMSGAHANIINSILTESFLREVSGREMLIVEVLLMAVVFILALSFSSLYFSLGTLLMAAAYILFAGAAFLYGNLIFNLVRPIFMIIFAVVSIIIYQYINEEKEKMESLRQRDFIRDTFGRYMSGEVVDEILDSPEGLKMSGEIREVTFLVSDLRGFTALTDSLSAHEIIEVINRYFEHMVDVISRYRGVVNEFLGDGILVFFGAPLQEEDDVERAVACAIDMQTEMLKVNETQRRLNLPELSMGIGINTGEVVVGNIGSERRAAYGAVGSPINIAYRIESFTVGGQILISTSTHEKVRSILQTGKTKQIQFKGIDHPVNIYDVIGLEGKYQIKLPEKKIETLVQLNPPLEFDCYSLEGKAVSEDAISGRILQAGETIAEASLPEPMKPHTNLRIILTPEGATRLPEMYAKVLPVGDNGFASSLANVRLQFTWIPVEAKAYLNKIRKEM